jgi:menaquinone-specific isochorismate synthase
MSGVTPQSDYLLTEYQLNQHGRLVSAALPAPGITAALFLRYAAGRARFLWRDGRSGVTFAGMGIAAELMAWGETRFQGIERQARDLFANATPLHAVDPLAAPRLFGGFAFREDFVPDLAWHGFNPAHFILPHYQLVIHDDQQWLTINALVPVDEQPESTAPQLHEALQLCYRELTALAAIAQSSRTPIHPLHQPTISYPMPFARWAAMIEEAQRQFRTTPLEKVVLARVCEVRQPTVVDLDDALTALQTHYPDCYTFLFEPQPHHAFFGATPELLAATQGEALTTMSLAGSIQRGATAAEDQALAAELLHSTKDRHEHALVVAAIRRRLEPLTTTLTIPNEPAIYPLNNIQHLYTPIQGRLQRATGILPVVEALHPTPALGGTPRDRALAFISTAETVPRGWYAGPVGWIDQTLDGAFGVAIRSAVAQERRVWLYAGAGIVAASEPEKEWIETGWKFRPIQSALGIT